MSPALVAALPLRLVASALAAQPVSLPSCSMLFVDFAEFTTNTEAVVRKTLEFVGADPAKLAFKPLPPGMQGKRRGRRMHPSVERKLRQQFLEPNRRLYALLGRDFQWEAQGSAIAKAASVVPRQGEGDWLESKSGGKLVLDVTATAAGRGAPAVAAMV